MTDPFVLDDEPYLLVVPSGAAIPASNITAPEWTALKDRVTNLEAMTMIDLDDVDLTGLFGGATLIFDNTDALWKPGTVAGSIERVGDSATGTIHDDVDYLLAAAGLQATVNGDAIMLSLVFGGTGSATSAARSDHSHTIPSLYRPTFGPTGYMSGGSRTLATQNVTLANGVTYLVKARLKPQMRGADAGAAYYTMTLDIGGNVRTSPGGASGFWCVQGVPKAEEWSHAHTITGTGAAITVEGSVAFHSGAGFNVDAGELEIELCPNK